MKNKAVSAIVLVVLLSILPFKVSGDEPCVRFLEALRDNGYYDIAMDYLDEMEASPLASAEFKQTLPFEKAQTLIKSTSRIRDLDELESVLSSAQALLDRAVSSATTPELEARSLNYQGELLFRRALIFLNRADNGRLTASEKVEEFSKARGYLKQSLEKYGAAKTAYKSLVDNFKLDVRDPESKQKQKLLRGTYTVVRVKLPQILEKYADTLEDTDPERKQNLLAAAKDFEQLWLKYPNFPAGLDSCLYAARCNYKLKDYPEALTFLQRIFGLPSNSRLSRLKRRAYVLAADCWSSMEKYPFDDVIANFEPLVANLNRRDRTIGDWQRVNLELAKAYHAKATELKATDPSDNRIKNFFRDAAKMVKALARRPGKYRDDARKYLAEWNLSVEASEPETVAESKPVKTFAEAKQVGADLIAEIEVLDADINDLKRSIRSGRGNTKELKAEVKVAKAKLKSLIDQCLQALRRSMTLVDSSISPEDVNQIRYLQSVCYLIREYFQEASLIGEFLVDRYPNIAFSRQAGGIAVRGYAALHDRSNSKDKTFERKQLSVMAEKMVDQFPGSNEAIDAAGTLVRLIIAKPELVSADLKQAMQYIDTIPENSLDRSVLNVKLGTKLWFAYRRMQGQPDVDQDELETSLAILTEYLSDGVSEFDTSSLRMDVAWGAVFLVNAYLDTGDISSAIEQLESAAVAPIDLLKQKNDVVFSSGKSDLYIVETYKTAAKTYLAALTKQPKKGAMWTDKAIGVVRALNARAVRSGDAKAKRDVVNMYRSIAVQLEKQLAETRDPEVRKQFVNNLNQFLKTLQSESDDANTVIWVGKTLMSLGDSFTQQEMPDQAKPLYTSAVAALDRAATMDVKGDKLKAELRRQQAIAKRSVGKFEDSYKELVTLLKETPNAWHIQMDAAKTLQQWGMTTKTKGPLVKALTGAEKVRDEKTKRQTKLVWGWSRLAEAFKNSEKHKEAYYTSLMAAVRTRFEYGVIDGNRKIVAAALKRLTIARNRDGEMGGAQWKPQFDELEKQIKQKMNTM